MANFDYPDGSGWPAEFVPDTDDPQTTEEVVLVVKVAMEAGAAYEPADADPSPYARELYYDADNQAYARSTDPNVGNQLVRVEDYDALHTVTAT